MPPIDLDRERNPVYFSLIDRSSELVEEYNRLNRQLHGFKFSKVLPFSARKRLNRLVEPLRHLQAQFTQWNNDAYPFIASPTLLPSEGAEPYISFLHHMSLLRDVRNRVSFDMELLVVNFDRIKSDVTNQINFFIAIASFLVSFGGLAASLISVWGIPK